MANSFELQQHKDWLGFIQPVGLVVSPRALVEAQAFLNRNVVPLQERLLALVRDSATPDFRTFAREILEWRDDDLAPPGDIAVALPEYDDVLRPTGRVHEHILIQELPVGSDFDAAAATGWQASHQARFERLLRESGVRIGILWNGTHLRLVYAPKGETSGHLTFPMRVLLEVAGRPVLAALHMLISEERLFSVEESKRLPAILEESRKYQNEVSSLLAEQVIEALYELVRGFYSANRDSSGVLLSDVLARNPNEVYGALLTVLLRLVFLLYAEDRALLSTDEVFLSSYSIKGLFERLRADVGLYPDTMDLRYGAWAQCLAVFRMINEGAKYGDLRIPPREGHLFDPSKYPFLEGINGVLPRVPDGIVYRALEKLLVLEGERISYRSLDVEQIGSVYEAVMGFTLRVARGPSIAIKPTKPHGAPVTIELDDLLHAPDRVKLFREETDQKLTTAVATKLKAATSIKELLAAIDSKVAWRVTPNILPAGSLVLDPSPERRRSGSHYTPRVLTDPIVRAALEPVLARLGENPTPEQLLDLKICDPAMGSGAFLVEACRHLGDVLVSAWQRHGVRPAIPPDEDEIIHAQRLVAQRCLYGVDRNPFAVDLAKLSLWLATFAKDHSFTFLDHALRHGDSLVGLSREELVAFHWEPTPQTELIQPFIAERVRDALAGRAEIRDAPDNESELRQRERLALVEARLTDIRMIGNMAVQAFFEGESARDRERKRQTSLATVVDWLLKGVRPSMPSFSVNPFHWQIEFAEVFERENPGFDVVAGNPPFAGKNTIIESHPNHYLDWLKALHAETHGNADLVAHFYRRAFSLIRNGGTFGLIATNTIGQGDTRHSGLRVICNRGGAIYRARRRLRWPGTAAVVVSVVHVYKGKYPGSFLLDGREVPKITAFLFHAGGNEDPAKLTANEGISFIGSYVLGMGFTFDDTAADGVASPISEMERVLALNARNRERVFPFLGGEEVNSSPTHAFHRYIVNFEEIAEDEARLWPDLYAVVERTKGTRASHSTAPWWQFERPRMELYRRIRELRRVLVISCGASPHAAFTFLETGMVYSHTLAVFVLDAFAEFCALQSRVHEVWVRMMSSSMKDDLRYTPTDSFETFPLPTDWRREAALETSGKTYFEFRAILMRQENIGMTELYNRFHNPAHGELDIRKLRELHDAMDRGVLDAYGWSDIHPRCEFIEEADEHLRFRWTDTTRDEVLARLLALNQKRAEEEAATETPTDTKVKGTRGRKKK